KLFKTPAEVMPWLRDLDFATFVIDARKRSVPMFATSPDWSYVVSVRPHDGPTPKTPDWIGWTPTGSFASGSDQSENLLGWVAIHEAPEKQPIYLLAASMGKENYDRSIIGRLFPHAAMPAPAPAVPPKPPVPREPRPEKIGLLSKEVEGEHA